MGGIGLTIQKKKEFLINAAYWALVLVLGYLVCAYLIPVAMPVIIGIVVARLIVALSRKMKCPKKWLRILLTLLIYGAVGLVVALLSARLVSLLRGAVSWLPEVYRLKLQPFGAACYEWLLENAEELHPALLTALELAAENIVAFSKNLLTALSSGAVNLVSRIAKGVPKFLLGLIVMIFSTVFVSNDYEKMRSFAGAHAPQGMKTLFYSLKEYVTGTLLVVLRSYLLIMLLTFTELSILFAVFGIGSPILKAALIALLDILPILGTGTVLIPWAIISLVVGSVPLGIKLLAIYLIVLVVRNYAEPKIVGAQLGLHPIITLASMFIGLRLFGFWGMFGFPIGISFLWKRRMEGKL